MTSRVTRGGTCCIVRSCPSRGLVDKISMFSLPKDYERAKQWLEATGRTDLLCKSPEALHRNYRLCAEHFENRMFLNDLRNRLQSHAVPTIFSSRSHKLLKRKYDNRQSIANPKKVIILGVAQAIQVPQLRPFAIREHQQPQNQPTSTQIIESQENQVPAVEKMSNGVNVQRFINNPSTVTVEALLGLVATSTNVSLLDFGKVIVRRDYNEMQEVKILSGGSSGHEPAFASFVGKGMLTAAIQGDVFVSPPSSEILDTIRELTNEQSMGILIIIPNNPSDRLNFGLAVERAKNEGINIEMVIVSDDCTSFKPKEGRGLCGAFLLQKIAGAMAQNNFGLQEIYNQCEKLKGDIFSLLLSVKPCSSTEKGVCESCKTIFAKTEMEIGAGLHGERGPIKMSITAVEYICKMIFEQMMDDNNEHQLSLEPEIPIILFINNLGITTKMEEYIFTKELLKYLKRINITVSRLYCDRFYTSLEMYGFTVTIMKVRKPEVFDWIDQPCEAPCWQESRKDFFVKNDAEFILKSKTKEAEVIEMRGPRLSKRQMNILLVVTQFACDALISCEKQLNVMDAESGDGDTGSRLKRGMDALNVELARHNINLAYPFVFLLSLSKLVEKTMGGTLGCIYSIMLEAAAKEFLTFSDGQVVGGWMWLYALKRAINAMMIYAESKEGDNTMFDPLSACAKVVEESLTNNMSEVEAFGNGVAAAEETAQKTKMANKKYPDPGAHAVGIWLRALYEGVKLRCE